MYVPIIHRTRSPRLRDVRTVLAPQHL